MRKYSKRKFVKNKRPSGKAKGSRIKKRKSTNRTKNRGKNRKRTMRGGTFPTYLQILQKVNPTKAEAIEYAMTVDGANTWDDTKSNYEKIDREFNEYRNKLIDQKTPHNELLGKLNDFVTDANQQVSKRNQLKKQYLHKRWAEEEASNAALRAELDRQEMERELHNKLGLNPCSDIGNPSKCKQHKKIFGDDPLKRLQQVENLLFQKRFYESFTKFAEFFIEYIKSGHQTLITIDELNSLISPHTVTYLPNPKFNNFLEALDKLQSDTRRETLTTLLAKEKDKSITTEETNVLRILKELLPIDEVNQIVAASLPAPSGFGQTPAPTPAPRPRPVAPIPAPRPVAPIPAPRPVAPIPAPRSRLNPE